MNSIGALVWAVTVGIAGYLFGHAVEAVLGEIKHFEKWLLLAAASGPFTLSAGADINKSENYEFAPSNP